MQNEINKERKFLSGLSAKIGIHDMKTLLEVKNVYDHLWTESEKGLKWSDNHLWDEEYERTIFEKLEPLTELLWKTEWNSSLVQRLRAGPLIEELVNNIKRVTDSVKNNKKVYFYSTHDAMIAVLLHSFGVFNGLIIPISASIVFELHQKLNSKQFYVRMYYINETEPEIRLAFIKVNELSILWRLSNR